jgi:hypothetical protein
MDLSKVSTKDLEYIKAGQLDKVSTAGLEEIARQRGTPAIPSASVVAPVPYSASAETLRSIAQGLTLNFADEIEAALRTGSISGKEYEELRNQLRGQQAQFRQDRPVAATASELTGGLAVPAALFARPVTRGLGIVGETALGGAMGGLSGIGAAQTPEEMSAQGVTGTLLGGGLTAGLSGTARLVAPSVRPEAAALREQGIPLTPGSAFGGRIQQVEQAAESIPILGGIVSGARERQFSEFNIASYNKVLSNIDPKLKVPKGLTGRDAFMFVEKSISDKYNDIVPDLAIKFTPKVQSGFDAIKNRYAKGNLSEADKQQFQTYVNSLEADFRASGVISGNKAQAVKQDLAKLSGTYSAGTGSTKLLGDAFKDLEGFYMNTLRNQNPKYASDLKKADSAYRDFVRVQTAMAKTRGEEGVFTPAQLESAVRQQDRSARKGAFARGAAPMQELSGRATSILGQKVPDSGTAARGMTAAALTGGVGFVDPLAGGLTALMTAPYYRLGERAMFAPRPASFTEAVQRARAASPFATPGLLDQMLSPLLVDQ